MVVMFVREEKIILWASFDATADQ